MGASSFFITEQAYKDSGWMSDGLACSRYVSGVGTNQLGNVIAAAYLSGIRDFDVAVKGGHLKMGMGNAPVDRY